MPPKGKGYLSQIDEFKKLLELKNRHLQALKEIAMELAEAEEEQVFVTKVLPIIGKAMACGEEVWVRALIDGRTIRVPAGRDDVFAAVDGYLETAGPLGRESKAVGLATLEHAPFASDLQEKGYAVLVLAPVFHEDADLGYLALPCADRGLLSSDNRIFLAYVCETIGIFLKNMQLRADFSSARGQLEQSLSELSAVYAVSKAVSTGMEMEAILANALDTVLDQEVLNIEAKGGIFLVNEEEGCLDLACHRGLPAQLAEQEASIPFGHCLCGLAAEKGEIITSSDCFSDERHHTSYEGMLPHGHIILPIKAKNRLVGVMFLYLPAGVAATSRQIAMLEAIANQLAVALENAKLYIQVKFLSLHDPLTGLANRNLLRMRLQEEIQRCRRFHTPLVIGMADIDFFKLVNDRHGHPAGDQVLRELAVLLKTQTRATDLVARFGGEEFILVMPNTTPRQAEVAAERIRREIAGHAFTLEGKPSLRVTVSIGLAHSPAECPVDESSLLQTADEALYQAKSKGRNRVCLAEPPSAAGAGE